MRQERKRRFFTAAESAEIWDRWRRGEGLKSISRIFGKSSSSIFAHVCPTGGIRPAAYALESAWLSRNAEETLQCSAVPFARVCCSAIGR